MQTPDEFAAHQMLPAEISGEVLVVRPRGMATGFSTRDISTEIDALSLKLESAQYDLLIDFSEANYVGSEVLGMIMKLGRVARDGDRRFAACGYSDTTLNVIETARLDQQIDLLGTRREALAAFGSARKSGALWIVVLAAVIGLAGIGVLIWWMMRDKTG